MRGLVIAAMMFGAAGCAHAADMPDLPVLRGSFPAGLSTATRNWDGWYAGGQVGYSSVDIDFRQSVVGLTNTVFRNSTLQQPTSQLSLLDRASVTGTGFGAFVGRNYQYDDLVFSLEANYNYINSLVGTSTATLGPLQITNPPGTVSAPGITPNFFVTLKGTATAQIKDVVTLRGRAGWAYENFLPYMFGGLAVGRMDVYRNVTSTVTERDDYTITDPATGLVFPVKGNEVPVPSLSPPPITQERTNDFVVGWTLGLGMEYMVWNCLFLRGEWEYIKFVQVMNTPIAMNSARLGIGYKF